MTVGRILAAMLAALLSGAAAAAEGLADPTLPPAVPAARQARGKAPAAPPPRLEGVLLGGARRLAILDGRTVGEGERVGSWRVARIGRGEVELVGGGRKVRLRLPLPPVERR
ncbi:hypothetical protein [Inmirania thermothiophila]|uniref:MSHA biogenesis protein MshK n=1 Tax=Inmirania thermothiophila TaxID=1750597 RepID=A0A3N1Y9Y4_9GAMM|nr:hypothetical protein [Inmirania thermothiophila]ROR34207.1 hypothetical protein EDC57_0103 [Inmirania thermothiophila]